MKKILHFQIPSDDKGNLTVPVQQVMESCDNIKKSLPKYYKVIFTPFKMTTLGNKTLIFDKDGFHDDKLEEQFNEVIKDKLENEGYIVELIK